MTNAQCKKVLKQIRNEFDRISRHPDTGYPSQATADYLARDLDRVIVILYAQAGSIDARYFRKGRP